VAWFFSRRRTEKSPPRRSRCSLTAVGKAGGLDHPSAEAGSRKNAAGTFQVAFFTARARRPCSLRLGALTTSRSSFPPKLSADPRKARQPRESCSRPSTPLLLEFLETF
jgi:hypothetical protein